jgi:hypothetical protein
MVLLHVQNSLIDRNVANAKGDIEQRIMDLNVPTILVWEYIKECC